jgi:uncharacterized protein YecE (DUF72 family)
VPAGFCFALKLSRFLTAEARRIAAWLARGIDVHAYFNNDIDAFAPRNAADLRRYVQRASR